MRSTYIITITVFFLIIGTIQTCVADEKLPSQYDAPYKTTTAKTMYYDLSKVSLKITNVQVLSMDDTPGYETDDASLVKITITVTNNDLERFVVLDKMFELWIVEPSKTDSKEFNVIDNHDTTWDDEFEVRYEKMNSRELYNECDRTIEDIKIGASLNFTLCYDILKSVNKGGVNLEGSKKYLLVMMDNHQSTSCPNCKKIQLTNDLGLQTCYMPKWVQGLYVWKEKRLISESDLQNALDYLASRDTVTGIDSKSANALFFKNKELAKYQSILSEAYSKNRFGSTVEIFESKYSDEFSGVVCKKQNNIITFDADYANDNVKYNTIFFRLRVYDDSGDMIAQGLSKIVNVAPKSYRHLSISTPFVEHPSYCLVSVDSKFF
jgi:hypothetical protein